MNNKGITLSTSGQNVKVKKLQLLKGIIKVIQNITTSDYIDVTTSFIDTINSISINDTPNVISKNLICAALTESLILLIAETNNEYITNEIELHQLDNTLNELITSNNYQINNAFFKRPKDLKLLNDLKPTLKKFLKLFLFKDHEISNILQRLNSYFVFSLINEWQRKPDYYQSLSKVLITPFNEAGDVEHEWSIYNNYLEHEINKPIFSETFSLNQIYIPLRAYFSDRSKSPYIDKRIVDLEEHLLSWLTIKDRSDSVRIIQGGPGFGKSSFLKMFAAKLGSLGKNTLLIPLHLFDLEKNLYESINTFLKYNEHLKHNPLDSTDGIILLFDGLDEISMQGEVLTSVANSFIREIERSVARYNNQKTKIQVIISGRDVIIQQNDAEFRSNGQILKLVPYFMEPNKRSNFYDRHNLLAIDQRDLWWKKYGKLKNIDYGGLPKDLAFSDFDKLTTQPLLNYIIAKSYERKNIKFSNKTNLNELYNDLLNEVYCRNYSGSNKHPSISNLEEVHFKLMLQEIALSAWHGSGRTTTVNEIEEHFKDSGLDNLLHTFLKDSENGVISLLAAFYFRQSSKSYTGLRTFEFTHKSFGEYLTALKITNNIQLISDKLNARNRNFIHKEGWDVKSCLVEWLKLFRNRALDEDLIKFIKNEFSFQFNNDHEKLSEILQTIVTLLNHTLQEGMPLEKYLPRLSCFQEEYHYSRNAERSLIVIHGILTKLTKTCSEILIPNEISFGDLLHRSIGQRKSKDCLILGYLNHLSIKNSILSNYDFSNSYLEGCKFLKTNFERSFFYDSDCCHSHFICCDFNRAFFHNSNFANSSFEEIKFILINFRQSNFSNCNFKDVKIVKSELKSLDFRKSEFNKFLISNSNLNFVKLSLCNFKATTLNESTLKKAILDHADLTDSKISLCDFTKSELCNSTLTNSTIEGSTFSKSDLRSIKFNNATIAHCDFQNSQMDDSFLINANLKDLNMCNTSLVDSNLSNSILTEVNLKKADLRRANFTNTKLNDVNLSETDLENANFEGATLTNVNLSDANIEGVDFSKTSIVKNNSEPINE